MTYKPPEKWDTYEKFRSDIVARQRDAEREGFEPTMELLGIEPWPPDWDALRATLDPELLGTSDDPLEDLVNEQQHERDAADQQ